MQDRWRVVIATAIVLALPLGGCGDSGQRDSWPVGTCVRVSDEGDTAAVSCAEPYTHEVIAIVAGDGEACPGDTDMYFQPADRGDGLMTTCLRAVAAVE
jgi:hypothetical protein